MFSNDSGWDGSELHGILPGEAAHRNLSKYLHVAAMILPNSLGGSSRSAPARFGFLRGRRRRSRRGSGALCRPRKTRSRASVFSAWQGDRLPTCCGNSTEHRNRFRPGARNPDAGPGMELFKEDGIELLALRSLDAPDHGVVQISILPHRNPKLRGDRLPLAGR